MAQYPKSGVGNLIVEVPVSYRGRHSHPVTLLGTSDQPAAEDSTYTTQQQNTRDEY